LYKIKSELVLISSWFTESVNQFIITL
jgi:hypothetical protein